jgi:hypothetical protein
MARPLKRYSVLANEIRCINCIGYVDNLWNVNIPGHDKVNGFPQAKSHYYTRAEGGFIESVAPYLGLHHKFTVHNIYT